SGVLAEPFPHPIGSGYVSVSPRRRMSRLRLEETPMIQHRRTLTRRTASTSACSLIIALIACGGSGDDSGVDPTSSQMPPLQPSAPGAVDGAAPDEGGASSAGSPAGEGSPSSEGLPDDV